MDRKAVLLLVFLLIPSFLSPASALTNSYTINSTTGEVDLGLGVKARATYSSNLDVTHDPTMGRGEQSTWTVRVSYGFLNISIYIPTPVSKWYSMTSIVPIGSYYDITVETGVTARVRILQSASLGVGGDGSLSVNSLSWDSASTKTFYVSADSDASGEITVSSSFSFQLSLGVVIGVSPLSIEIANTNLGTFPASPTMYENVNVIVAGFDWNSVLPYLLIVVLFLVFYGFTHWQSIRAAYSGDVKESIPAEGQDSSSDMPKSQEEPKDAETEKTFHDEEGTVYCMFCGQKLPSGAVYCKKCGKKVE